MTDRQDPAPADADPSAIGVVKIDPKTAEADLMRLVLTIADFPKETLERQAIRRMERGTVDEDQIAAMSEAFEKMDRKIEALCADAGVKRGDLDIALGPFGSLMGRMDPRAPEDARGVEDGRTG